MGRLIDIESLAASLHGYAPNEARTPYRAYGSGFLAALKQLHALRCEGLALYVTLPHLEPFHASTKRWRGIDGPNRGGKSLACAAESSRAWTNADPYNKYVRRNGRAIVISNDLDNIARIWATLTEEGQFFTIRDEHTKLWRGVRPDPRNPNRLDPYDEAYREKWKPAPPLIPPRLLIGEPAWEDKRKRVPRRAFLATGWNILFRSGNSDPERGQHYNQAWIDEQLAREEHFEEINRGLVGLATEKPEHRPKGIWSATSQDISRQFHDLRRDSDRGAEYVEFFSAPIENNPHIPEEEKRIFWESLQTEEARQLRYYGVYAITSRWVYSHFDAMGHHGCEPFLIPSSEYARYVILDPGRTHAGTLFIAVPPDESHVYVYDGFDLRNSHAKEWADMIVDRQGAYKFEAFIIDDRMGRQHAPGPELSSAEHYWQALQEVGVEPRMHGPVEGTGFFAGGSDVMAREEALLAWMQLRDHGPFSGTAKLQVFRGRLPELERQILNAHTDPKRKNKRVTGKGIQEDLLVCLEYAANFGLVYNIPEVVTSAREREKATIWHFHEEFQRKQRRGRSIGDGSLRVVAY